METLKIEHITPYFNYKLKMINNGFIGELTVLKTNLDFRISCSDWTETLNGNYKPILRPLSDLVKEIEHNGEKFVPIFEIAKTFLDAKQLIVNIVFIQAFIDKYICPVLHYTYIGNNEIHAFYLYNSEYTLNNATLIIQKLFEWHFDVFGLIEKGLAIDINTLNK